MGDEPRCLQCGEVIHEEENHWVCVGCGVWVDYRGRRLRSQPTSAEKVRRRFAQRSLFEPPEPGAPPGVTRRIPNYEEPPPTRVARRPRRTGKLWCKPCDALFVRRAGRTMCWRCGVIWEAA